MSEEKEHGMTEEEKAVAWSEFREIVGCIKEQPTSEQLVSLEAAFSLALSAHDSQRRQSGEPYILHPLGVTKILAISFETATPLTVTKAFPAAKAGADSSEPTSRAVASFDSLCI